MAVSFAVGAIECVLLEDGWGGLPPEILFGDAPAEERDAALGARRSPDGRVLLPSNCLLVRTAEHVVLVDTGIGSYEHPLGGTGGRLERELADAGIAADDVDVVVITHGHLDHIGGLCRDGRPRFGGARHLVSRVEWSMWTDGARLREMGGTSATVAREQLGPLRDAVALELVEGTSAVVEGVRLVPAPGHTPGQVAVEIDEGALYLADVVADPLHAEHPDWVMAIERDAALARETRQQLLDRAVDDHLTVAAAHLAGPARVQRSGAGFTLVPLEPGG